MGRPRKNITNIDNGSAEGRLRYEEQTLFPLDDYTMEELPKFHKPLMCSEGETLEEYCTYIYEWLLQNTNAISVLDFFEDMSNRPFRYTLADVLAVNDRNIYNLLEQRIAKEGLRGKFKAGMAIAVLNQKYNWDNAAEVNATADNGEIKFKFGD